MSNYKSLLEDRLAESLDPELRDRYKKRRADAMKLQEQSYQGPEAAEALAEGQRMRALQAGLTKAANKFGSVMGDGGPKSDIDSTMGAFNEADKTAYGLKEAMFRDAVKNEDSAVNALASIGDRQVSLANRSDSFGRELAMRERDDAKYSREQGIQKGEDDPNSEVSRSYQDLAKRMTGGKGNYAGKSATELKQVVPSLEKLYNIDESRRSRLESAQALAANRADAAEERRLIREERKEDKAALQQEKKTQTELETSIPGYEKTGEAAIRPTDVEKLRKAAATQETIDTQLDELIRLQEKYGDYETGPNGERMAALSSSIQLKLKELENLGVLNGPDLAILQKQIPDVGNTLVSRNDNTGAKLVQGKKMISDMTKNNLEKSGFRKKFTPLTVRNPKTGESATVSSQAELDEARAEGFTQ